jgi:hypothetical protein
MNRIRLASKEEVDKLRPDSDITPDSVVLALDTQLGTCTAVVRPVIEVDPVTFPADFPDRLKVVFMRDVETYLSAKGVGAYYFNILDTDTQWQEVSKTWGATSLSTGPETRFKKIL